MTGGTVLAVVIDQIIGPLPSFKYLSHVFCISQKLSRHLGLSLGRERKRHHSQLFWIWAYPVCPLWPYFHVWILIQTLDESVALIFKNFVLCPNPRKGPGSTNQTTVIQTSYETEVRRSVQLNRERVAN